MIDNWLTTVDAFRICILASLSVDKIWLPKYVSGLINFGGLALNAEMAPFGLKNMNSDESAFTKRTYIYIYIYIYICVCVCVCMREST